MPGVTIKPHSNAEEKNKYLALSFAIAFGYFTFGAITNVAGAIIPKISETYNVSPSLSVVLAAVFFIAYGFTSLPWGLVITAAGKKKTLIYSTCFCTSKASDVLPCSFLSKYFCTSKASSFVPAKQVKCCLAPSAGVSSCSGSRSS
jgi:fucose permease